MEAKQIHEVLVKNITQVKNELLAECPKLDNETFNVLLFQAVQEVCTGSNVKSLTQSMRKDGDKPVRVYVDGCFDIMHSGHYNVLRQAKQLGDIVVAGVHSDAEILINKGHTVMKNDERIAAVKACKWVDEVVFDTPYSPTIELLDSLNCDFGVHGDDLPIGADGNSCYDALMRAGRLRIVKRTEGVSTTDIVGRLLLMDRSHFTDEPEPLETETGARPRCSSDVQESDLPTADDTVLLRAKHSFLPTSWRISQFSNRNHPKSTDTVVYVDGAFDLFHVGHIELLKRAKEMGTFLLVGVHSDQLVNEKRGKNFPVMNLHERVLNVLSCKYVDDVVIGAPWQVSTDMIKTFNIKCVACGTNTKLDDPSSEDDAYVVARAEGILREVPSEIPLTTHAVIRRIIDNHEQYQKRNSTRAQKEQDYLQTKEFMDEV
eukprot:TRINITY_DN562_c0_g2_i1.p1 TRINITY_DN562_c0_g2~~TRINITY_DN562_c0_g2_i1.p1  ORF type:complete len:431 (+),score=135.21 TRINITY_DN562_c0_g2_i1:87-1379(+)